MLYDGRVMSISYRIEVQLNNEKVSKITLRKASLFFGGGGGGGGGVTERPNQFSARTATVLQ